MVIASSCSSRCARSSHAGAACMGVNRRRTLQRQPPSHIPASSFETVLERLSLEQRAVFTKLRRASGAAYGAVTTRAAAAPGSDLVGRRLDRGHELEELAELLQRFDIRIQGEQGVIGA